MNKSNLIKILCCVCHENFNKKENIPILMENCGHSLCRKCKWKYFDSDLTSSKICPLCKVEITDKNINNQFLKVLNGDNIYCNYCFYPLNEIFIPTKNKQNMDCCIECDKNPKNFSLLEYYEEKTKKENKIIDEDENSKKKKIEKIIEEVKEEKYNVFYDIQNLKRITSKEKLNNYKNVKEFEEIYNKVRSDNTNIKETKENIKNFGQIKKNLEEFVSELKNLKEMVTNMLLTLNDFIYDLQQKFHLNKKYQSNEMNFVDIFEKIKNMNIKNEKYHFFKKKKESEIPNVYNFKKLIYENFIFENSFKSQISNNFNLGAFSMFSNTVKEGKKLFLNLKNLSNSVLSKLNNLKDKFIMFKDKSRVFQNLYKRLIVRDSMNYCYLKHPFFNFDN